MVGGSGGVLGFFALIFIHEMGVQGELGEVFRSCSREFETPDLGSVLSVRFFDQVDWPKIFDSAGGVDDAKFLSAVPSGLGN